MTARRATTVLAPSDAAEALPTWAMLDGIGDLQRYFGWIVETEVGGAQFLSVQMPVGRSRLLVNAKQVRTITVVTEEIAMRFAPSAWRGR